MVINLLSLRPGVALTIQIIQALILVVDKILRYPTMLCNTGLVYVWELEWLEGNISVREECGRIGWRRPGFALIRGNCP